MDIRSAVELEPNPNIAEFGPGDTVKVSYRIVEAGKERIQPFTGMVIRTRQSGPGGTFTVRQILQGIGVERTFPYHSPLLEKVDVVTRAKVRRAKLYYTRGLSRKRTRAKIKQR